MFLGEISKVGGNVEISPQVAPISIPSSGLRTDLCGGTLTGMEVAERKSVMRFLLTISVSALPGSRREEDRDTTLRKNSTSKKLNEISRNCLVA